MRVYSIAWWPSLARSPSVSPEIESTEIMSSLRLIFATTPFRRHTIPGLQLPAGASTGQQQQSRPPRHDRMQASQASDCAGENKR